MGPDSLEKTFIDFTKYYGLNFQIFKGETIKNNFFNICSRKGI